jgi:hypothetical protein
VESADCGCVCSFAFRGPIPRFGSYTIVERAEQWFETAAVVIQISTDTKHRIEAVKLFLGCGLSVRVDQAGHYILDGCVRVNGETTKDATKKLQILRGGETAFFEV